MITDPIITINKTEMTVAIIELPKIKPIPHMLQNIDSLEVLYPQAIEFAERQLDVFWMHKEVKVEKDIQDILVNMTPAEKHGVITVLKLFTLYELKAGSEYWSGRFKDRFKRHEFQRMALTFAMFEVAVHKPFYSKINELLFLDNDEFYSAYTQDEVLKSRMKFIDDVIDDPDDLVSLAGFSLIEGVILYSSFAYLKHFQSQGKNKLMTVVRGINFSSVDENIHSEGGAWTFRTLKSQSSLTSEEEAILKERVRQVTVHIYEHECHIVDLIFSKGNIDGITAVQMKHFIESRLNSCLALLGYEKMFDVKYNPIGEWFYTGINAFKFNDTFSGVGNSYHRNWDETAFVWEVPETDVKENLDAFAENEIL